MERDHPFTITYELAMVQPEFLEERILDPELASGFTPITESH